MISFAARTTYWDQDRKVGVISVQSSKCWYRVAITAEEITVVGPGVEETYEPIEGLSHEGNAIVAVLKFEEQE